MFTPLFRDVIIHTALGTLVFKCLPVSNVVRKQKCEVQLRNLSIGSCSVCFVNKYLEKVQIAFRFFFLTDSK